MVNRCEKVESLLADKKVLPPNCSGLPDLKDLPPRVKTACLVCSVVLANEVEIK